MWACVFNLIFLLTCVVLYESITRSSESPGHPGPPHGGSSTAPRAPQQSRPRAGPSCSSSSAPLGRFPIVTVSKTVTAVPASPAPDTGGQDLAESPRSFPRGWLPSEPGFLPSNEGADSIDESADNYCGTMAALENWSEGGACLGATWCLKVPRKQTLLQMAAIPPTRCLRMDEPESRSQRKAKRPWVWTWGFGLDRSAGSWVGALPSLLKCKYPGELPHNLHSGDW